MKLRYTRVAVLLGLAAGLMSGGQAMASDAYRDFGDGGRPQDVRRTITIVMRDNSYEPRSIRVRAGETVRFRIQNRGEFVHEFNIGTAAMHVAHQREMRTMMENGHMTPTNLSPAGGRGSGGGHGAHGSHGSMTHGSMMHNDPNSILLEPGQSGELIWKFTRAIDLEFACNVPGHYESGMVGRVDFTR